MVENESHVCRFGLPDSRHRKREMLHKFNEISLGPILANSVGLAMGDNYAEILSDYYIYIYMKDIKVSIYSTYSICVACAVSVFPLTDSHWSHTAPKTEQHDKATPT